MSIDEVMPENNEADVETDTIVSVEIAVPVVNEPIQSSAETDGPATATASATATPEIPAALPEIPKRNKLCVVCNKPGSNYKCSICESS